MKRYIIPYCANTPLWITAVVATNLEPIGVRYVLTYRDASGKTIASKAYTAGPYAIQVYVPDIEGRFSAECESSRAMSFRCLCRARNARAEEEWLDDPGIPVDQYITETDSRNMVAWPKDEAPYWRFAGVLDLLQARHLTALKLILKRFWHETGLQAEVQDLNSKTQSQRHPDGTHIGSDADFGYFDDPAATWALWEDLLATYSDAIVMTHIAVWRKMLKCVAENKLLLLNDRVLKDENPTWNHDTHFHLRIAKDAAGAIAGVNWGALY